MLGKCYFDLKEYDRASNILQSCTSEQCCFLEQYARYLSGQKKNLDNSTDSPGKWTSFFKHFLLKLISQWNNIHYYNEYCSLHQY